MTNADLLEEKIELAEKESNDMKKIEQEKRQFDALQDWSKKPRYEMKDKMKEPIWMYIPYWLRVILFPILILPVILLYLFIRRKELNKKI